MRTSGALKSCSFLALSICVLSALPASVQTSIEWMTLGSENTKPPQASGLAEKKSEQE